MAERRERITFYTWYGDEVSFLARRKRKRELAAIRRRRKKLEEEGW